MTANAAHTCAWSSAGAPKVGVVMGGASSSRHNAAFIAVCAVFSASIGLPVVCWLAVPRGGSTSQFAGVDVLAETTRTGGGDAEFFYRLASLPSLPAGRVVEVECSSDSGNFTCVAVESKRRANGTSGEVVRLRYDADVDGFSDDRFGRLRYAVVPGACFRNAYTASPASDADADAPSEPDRRKIIGLKFASDNEVDGRRVKPWPKTCSTPTPEYDRMLEVC